jgi:hypothetical protein
MIYFDYLFVLCLLLIWIYVLCIGIGRRRWLSEPGWIWWLDFIIIMACFFYTFEKDRKSIGCTNTSMMLGLSMLHNRVLWKRWRKGSPLFFYTLFIFFFRLFNYEWGRMTYFNLCISSEFSMNMFKHMLMSVAVINWMDLWQDVKIIITCFLTKKNLRYFEVHQQKIWMLKCKHWDNSSPGTTKHANGNSSANASDGDTAPAFERW